MPASNVPWASPLVRLPPFYPGQVGIRGSDSELGLRQHTDGVVFYVNPNHPESDDNNDGTNPDHPLATVGNALTKCQPMRGDVIAVMSNNAWSFPAGFGNPADGYLLPIEENVIVTVPGVRIVGISQSSSTGVMWTPATNGGTCITVNAIDVSIEGFLFDEGGKAGCNAIAAVWNGTTAFGDNLTVRNCVFSDTVDIGISLEFVWFANIHHNVFWECDAYGIYSLQPGSGNEFLSISDNLFHDVVTCAMSLVECSNSHVFNNSIYNANAATPVAATNQGIVTTTGGNNQIFDNHLSCPIGAVPGGWADFCSGVANSDAWINNHLLDGMSITTP